MKKIGYFSCIIFFMFLVGCSTMTLEKEYLVNPNNEDTKKQVEQKKRYIKILKYKKIKRAMKL